MYSNFEWAVSILSEVSVALMNPIKRQSEIAAQRSNHVLRNSLTFPLLQFRQTPDINALGENFILFCELIPEMLLPRKYAQGLMRVIAAVLLLSTKLKNRGVRARCDQGGRKVLEGVRVGA